MLGSNSVALLSLIVFVQQSSSFITAWLCIVFPDCFKVLVIIVIVRLANQRATSRNCWSTHARTRKLCFKLKYLKVIVTNEGIAKYKKGKNCTVFLELGDIKVIRSI